MYLVQYTHEGLECTYPLTVYDVPQCQLGNDWNCVKDNVGRTSAVCALCTNVIPLINIDAHCWLLVL